MQDNQAEYSQPEERQGQSSEGSELLQEGSPLSSPPPPTPASVLREGGVIMPQLDSLEAVLLALSHAQRDGGWQEVGQEPTYIHRKERSTTEVRLRPPADAIVTDADLSSQLWQRVGRLDDLTGDILLAILAQMAGAGSDPRDGVWITSTLILEYRGIQPKAYAPKRQKPKTSGTPVRASGHRIEDLQLIADHFQEARNLHVTVRRFQESHKKIAPRKRMFTQESYLLLVSDYVEQTTLPAGQEITSLQVAWRVLPGACLETMLSEPNNYRATWLFQCVLHYDPYHEAWEKRLGRYCCFQLRFNSAFGGVTIKRRIRALLDELGLEVNEGDPAKTRKRFEQAMDRLCSDGIISEWGPQEHYTQQVAALPRYRWLERWLDFDIEIFAAPLSHAERDLLQEHLQHQRSRRKRPQPDENP